MAMPQLTQSRRRFLTDKARMAGGCAVVGLGLAYGAFDARALPADALRRPGALAEEDLLSACIDVCAQNLFAFTHRFDESVDEPPLKSAPEQSAAQLMHKE